LRFLLARPREEDRLLAQFEKRRTAGEPFYSSLLFILAHLSFPEAEAERHFRRILLHRQALRGRLGRDPGLRVAILDYFQNVSHALKNPLVIELKLYERTERSAVTDGLTGLFNASYFREALRREVERARRHGFKISLVLFDLDDFKGINDTKGHLAGDKVLVRAAAVLRESAREIDVAARWGGEEFALILPETARTGAYVVAERVRARVESHFRRGRGPRVTVSGGVASWPEDGAGMEDLIRKADQAMYRAKALGKNRVFMGRGERRRHPRMPASRALTVAARGGERAARARNVSAGGLLLSLDESVPVGSAVSIVLRAAGQPPRGLRGEVVHVDRTGRGQKRRYDVGVRFLGRPGRQAAHLVLRRGRV
jgi:diguanylate cyclase (GGDEF)-like protein